MDYTLYSKKQINEGLYSLEHVKWYRQWWTKCKVRKDHKCAITERPIKKGSEAYRPITNCGNRYHRICVAFFDKKWE